MNRLVVVTGASRGIGYACALHLLRAGFEVHLVARSQASLQAARRSLEPYGTVTASTVDLSSRPDIELFTTGWSRRIWGLVNNAGAWAEERIDEPDGGLWDRIMRLNLDGPYFLTKGLQRYIVPAGRIVNMSSQLGTGGRAGFGPYAASKHGLIGLTRCWALELGVRGITVNAVCPGWVRTASNLDELGEEHVERIAGSLTLGRFIEPEEVAQLVGFLVGDGGSGVTGQIYEIK